LVLTWNAVLSLCGWIVLAFFRGRFWVAGERLTEAPDPARWPEVVAVMPARNEAESIGEVLRAALRHCRGRGGQWKGRSYRLGKIPFRIVRGSPPVFSFHSYLITIRMNERMD